MSDWYYSVGGAQQGPVATEQLRQWAQTGQFGPQVLVWREGMGQWQPAKQVPELLGLFQQAGAAQPAHDPQQAYAPAQAAYAEPAATLSYQGPSHNEGVSPRTIDMLVQTKPWVRLFSVLMYIAVVLLGIVGLLQLLGGLGMATSSRRGGGSFAALGALSAIVTIAIGLLYFFPAMYLGRYASRIGMLQMSRRQADLEGALEAQKSYWKFIGVLTLIVICIYVLVFVIALIGAGAMSSRF